LDRNKFHDLSLVGGPKAASGLVTVAFAAKCLKIVRVIYVLIDASANVIYLRRLGSTGLTLLGVAFKDHSTLVFGKRALLCRVAAADSYRDFYL